LLVQQAKVPAIAINDNGIDVTRNGSLVPAMAPWADLLYASDAHWWRQNAQQALKFPGIKVSCSEVEFRAVHHLKNAGVEGFDPDNSKIRTGGNSGYAAIHIAIHAKASRILLLGFDMGGTHWFGKHQAPLRNTDPGTFQRWIPRFTGLIGRGSEIINCTPGSALTCFPFMPLEDALP
jgi:hypothetical protein